MAKNTVWTGYYTGLSVGASDSRWTLARGGAIFVPANDGTGIRQGSNLSNNDIVVKGTVDTPYTTGLLSAGADTRVSIDVGGTITAYIAVQLLGDQATFFNNGYLHGNLGLDVQRGDAKLTNGESGVISGEAGITVSGSSAKLVNDGQVITRATAINVDGIGSTIINNSYITSAIADAIVCNGAISVVNGEDGAIQSHHGGIIGLSHGGDTLTVTNHGSIISAARLSIVTTDGDDLIINDGDLYGDIMSGNGNDTIDMRHGGTIEGSILGQAGNDTLITDSAKFTFAAGDGAVGDVDTIKSTVGYTLMNGVDRLVLLGKKNIDATGDNVDNILIGNKGNNVLTGGGGVNHDTLTGGKGDDEFLFTFSDGQYVIKDFENGHDHIGITGYDAISSFADLQGRITQQGDDVLIVVSAVGGRSIILEDTKLSEIDRHDFFFV